MVKLIIIAANGTSLPSKVVLDVESVLKHKILIKNMPWRETGPVDMVPLIAVVACHMLVCRFTMTSPKAASAVAILGIFDKKCPGENTGRTTRVRLPEPLA